MTVEVAWARGLRRRSPVGARAVKAAVEAALEHGRRAGTPISVAIVADRQIAGVHGRWFDDPTPTDVISFDLGGEDGPVGELYVSLDTALRVARERRIDPARELLLYVVHGTLHLCGLDDTTAPARARMRRAEALVLARLARSQAVREVARRTKNSKKLARRARPSRG